MKFELEKFKQSNVARIFVAYAVVAFGMMQIFDYLLPIIEAPLWVAQTLTLLLFLGFPISLLVGWVTQRPIVKNNTGMEVEDADYVNSMSRQKIIMIGLGSSVIFGFLGFISMPYLLDQASFVRSELAENTVVQQSAVRRSLRSELNLGITPPHVFWQYRTEVALSPDGTKLVYVVFNGTGAEIFLRDLLNLDSTRLLANATGGGVGKVTFSDDGEWVIYIDNRNLTRVRVEGGAPQTLTTSLLDNSGVESGEEVYYFTTASRLEKFSLGDGGTSETIAEGPGSFHWPRILPGGTHLLVTSAEDSMNVGETAKLELLDLNTLERETLVESAFNATYIETGHIIFSRDAALWAVPFDLSEMRVSGEQRPVLQEIETEQRRGAAIYSISKSGRLVYLRGNEVGSGGGGAALARLNREGTEIETADTGLAIYGNLSLSPDERQVALTIFESAIASDIWIWDLNRDILGRRTFEGNASRPIWSPDGRTIIYRTLDRNESENQSGIWSIQANGTSQPVPIFLSDRAAWPRTISENMDLIFTLNDGGVYEAFTFNLTQAGGDSANSDLAEVQAQLLDLAPEINAFAAPMLSPDGKWLAYGSSETGTPEVYVRPWPDIAAGKWQVSIGSGGLPLWNKNANEIIYINPNGIRQTVAFREGGSTDDGSPSFLELDRPESLDGPSLVITENRLRTFAYRSSEDDFLVVVSPTAGSIQDLPIEEALSRQTSLILVEDWFDELRSIAPPDVD